MALGCTGMARGEALDTFKALAGSWSISANSKTLSIEMTYAAASKGHVVTEKFGQELSVFWMDGPALIMTHYCNFGNVPMLRLVTGTPANVRRFDLVRVDDLRAPDDDHVKQVIYRFRNDHAISLDIVWYHPAGDSTEHYELTRP